MRWVTWIIGLLLTVFLHAAEPPPEPMIAIRGQQYPASQVQQAYDSVKTQYAYDQAKSKLVGVKEAGATVYSGTVKRIMGAKQALLESDGQYAMVDTHYLMEVGVKVDLVLREKGRKKVRLQSGQQVLCTLYQDLSITPKQFLTMVRQGYEFKGTGLESGGKDIFRNDKKGVALGGASNLGKPGLSQRKESGFERRTTTIKRTKRKIDYKKK